MITVGLPNYCSPIAWLAMESLCRQQTSYEWELIIYEDSDKPLGPLFYSGYSERLEAAGCKRLIYEYSKARVPLNQKWLWMGDKSDPESLGLILQASDCYSEPHRIETAHKAFEQGYDWVQTNQGFFYNLMTGQMMKYNDGVPTGLNMAVKMSQLKSMPRDQDRWSGVDYWLFMNLCLPKVFIDKSTNWGHGIDTDGYGRISLERKKQYDNPQHPFYNTAVPLSIILPDDVLELLNNFEHKL